MKKMFWALPLVLLFGCDGRYKAAQDIVRNELGQPEQIVFRDLKANRDGTIVCGEVTASDKPLENWRFFVAYLNVKGAAVSPTASRMTAAAEMGNPLLAGAAEEFYHACD
jgi:hypothetical protein